MEQTDRSQRGGGLEGLEECSPRTYTHISKVHGHRQQCGEGGSRGLVEWDKGRGMEDISNNVSKKKI